MATAHKGIVWLKLTTRGRAAHASTPWDGINAVGHAAHLLHRVETELVPELARRRHPLTPPPSVNIGLIRGGLNPNMVADRCEVHLDRRTLPGETVEQVLAEIQKVIERTRAEVPELAATVEVVLHGPALETAPEAEIVRQSTQVCRDLDLPAEPAGYVQASDGRFFSERGIPTVLIGPGNPQVAHAPDEHVALADVHRAASIYALLAYRMLRAAE